MHRTRFLPAIALSLVTTACWGPSAGTDGGIQGDAGTDHDGGSPMDGGGSLDGGTSSACSDPLPAGRVTLPDDDALHTEPTEWWYWTGHLFDPSGRAFGFELAFFVQDSPQGRGQMVHHALTDIQGGTFHHTAGVALGVPPPVAGGFDLAVQSQAAQGGGGHDVLHGEVDGYVLDLTLDAVKRPVLQHGDGYTDYSFGGYTYYYSRERMATSGTLQLPDGTTLEVTGTSWFDHQWGTLQDAIDLGWDWFALQLDDERELMLFIVRDPNQDLLVGGSLTGPDCAPREILPDEFQVTAKGTWQSPHGKQATYPSGWTIEVLGETFEVDPVLEDQEVDALFFRYWEGACTVTGPSGEPLGRAYVELTGY